MIQTLDPQTEDSEIFSIDAYRVAELNALFWQREESKRNNIVAFSRLGSSTAAVTTVIGFGTPVLAGGGGGTGGAADAASEAAAETIATGVENAINMITAINGLGGAAFGVALAPLGFMLTLRILNMVLSRV